MRTVEREAIHLARAPRDVLEQPRVRLRQPDQGIAAVMRRTEYTLSPRRTAPTAARRINNGSVGLSALTTITPPWPALQQRLRSSGQDAPEKSPPACGISTKPSGNSARKAASEPFWRVKRIGLDAAATGQSADGPRHVLDEASRQRRAFFWLELRRQPRLRLPGHRRLADHGDGNGPHLEFSNRMAEPAREFHVVK